MKKLFILIIILIIFIGGCQFASPFFSSDTGMQTQVSHLSTQVAMQGTILSYLSTSVGSARLTPMVATPTFTPGTEITGSVIIEDGACCAGGTEGEQITIEAAFIAASPYGEITDMRMLAGGYAFTEEDLQNANWVPYTEKQEFWQILPINWMGFYVCAQFRDEVGNLSQVICDDIALEGAPEESSP